MHHDDRQPISIGQRSAQATIDGVAPLQSSELDRVNESLPRTLEDWLARCEHAYPAEIDLTLDRVRRVKDRLGVQFKVPVIMVTGTNGKGSVCAMLESIALQAGWRIGCYSKPHLVRFEERCRVNGRAVTADRLVPHFKAVEESRRETALTYFEHTTLAILNLLSSIELDLVILEVGLGGRCDAVNVIDADCSVITTVDIDHTEYLGPTREAIGKEKAGIMRPGRAVVVGDPDPPASLYEHARDIGARLFLIGRDFHVSSVRNETWTWHYGSARRDDLPRPALAGDNQIGNAAVALAALASIGVLPAPSSGAVASGLTKVRLAGRFQVLSGRPRVILDVAHNRQAARSLAVNLSGLPREGRTFAVFGCMRDKDIAALIEAVFDLVDGWYLTDLPLPRAATARHVSEALLGTRQYAASNVPYSCWESPWLAFGAAKHEAQSGDSILVFGSFYTVGGVLRHLDDKDSAGGLAPREAATW